VRFAEAQAIWAAFYERFGVPLDGGVPNTTGWVNVPCVLPTHKHRDREKHGAVNVISGSYRCWHSDCLANALRLADQDPTRQRLSPIDFLVALGHTRDDARHIVDAFRAANPLPDEPDVYSSTYPGQLPGVVQLVEQAQAQLAAHLDLVQDYMRDRGLTFDTLTRVGAGYLPATETQEECLVLPYYMGGKVVGVRGRTADGRKGAVRDSWFTLYNLQSVADSPSPTAVIVEGETDCLVMSQLLHDAGHPDVPVLGTPGARFAMEWARHINRFKKLIVVPQADQAAQALVDQLRRACPNRVTVVALPWKEGQWGKDVADFVLQNGPGPILERLPLTTDEAPRLLTLKELSVLALQPPRWVIEGLLERGTKTLLCGPPKTGKTWICLQMLRAVAFAEALMGIEDWKPVQAGKAMLVEEEGVLQRLAARVMCLVGDRVEDEPRLFFMHRQHIRVDVDEALEQLVHDVKEVGPDLLVIDPYAEIHGQDENTAQGTQVVVAGLNRFLDACPDTALVVVHHTRKLGGGPRGSSALEAAVDTILEVGLDEKTEELLLYVTGRDLHGFEVPMRFTFRGDIGRHVPTPPVLAIHPS